MGANIAEQYFNQQQGVNGTPIKIILQDVAGDEQGAINAFNTLINKHKVVGIVGPSLSQQAFAADPIAQRAKVPVLGPSNRRMATIHTFYSHIDLKLNAGKGFRI